jgi:hypothetical protein
MHKSGARTRTGASVALRAYDLHTRPIDATRSRPTVFRPAMRVHAGGHDRARVGAQETGSAAWLLRAPRSGSLAARPWAKLPTGCSATMILHRPAGAIWRVMASMM